MNVTSRARALFIREFFAEAPARLSPAQRRRRDAIRAVTLLDAPRSELKFSMDDYRDSCLADMERALAWLKRTPPAEPSARRRAIVEGSLAALAERFSVPAERAPKGRVEARASVSAVLRKTVLRDWSKRELLRIAALLFETGFLRDPAQLDGPIWHSGKRDHLRFHAPTARRLFPRSGGQAKASSKKRGPGSGFSR